MNDKIKIYCHSCDGKGFVEEKEYPNAKIVKVVCPECNGQKFIHDEIWHCGE